MDNNLIVGLLDFTHYIFELIGDDAKSASLTTVSTGASESATYLDPIPLLKSRIESGEILEIEEVARFIDLLLTHQCLPGPDSASNGSGKTPFTEVQKKKVAFHLADFFERYFRSRGTWEIDAVELVGRFDLELELWQRSRFPIHGIAPLADFESESGELTLSDHVAIKRFTPLSKEYHRPRDLEITHDGIAAAYADCDFYLEYSVSEVPVDDSQIRDLPFEARSYLTAMKLIKPGTLGTLFISEERWNGHRFVSTRFRGDRHQYTPRSRREKFTLHQQDLAPINQIISRLIAPDGQRLHPPQEFALRRYAQSYRRIHPEDLLLDYVLILESIAGTPRRKVKTIAKNTAGFVDELSETGDESPNLPESVTEHVKAMTNARDAIVHQGATLEEALPESLETTATEFLRDAEEIVRRALHGALLQE